MSGLARAVQIQVHQSQGMGSCHRGSTGHVSRGKLRQRSRMPPRRAIPPCTFEELYLVTPTKTRPLPGRLITRNKAANTYKKALRPV
jgi:hypothetical protein